MKETTHKTKREGRIVNVSSVAYRIFTYREGILFDKINDPKRERKKERMENKEEQMTKKRSRGRQKIPIEKIANKKSLLVTFSKRKTGLFKKASALTALGGVEVAVIVESPVGNLFSFGNPSVDSVIHRFETEGFGGPKEDGFNVVIGEDSEIKHLEAHKDKEIGKSNWWEDLCLENLGLQELEECMSAMEVLKKNLLKRADDLGMANSSSDVF